MTTKRHATEIFNGFKKQIEYNCQPSTVNGVVKKCSLIHVNGIITQIKKATQYLNVKESEQDDIEYNIGYWKKILEHIEEM